MQSIAKWFIKNKIILITAVCIISLLAAGIMLSRRGADSHGSVSTASNADTTQSFEDSAVQDSKPSGVQSTADNRSETSAQISQSSSQNSVTSGSGKGQTAVSAYENSSSSAASSVPKPLPTEPENAKVTDRVYHCTMSISCSALAEDPSKCTADKAELIPDDGWILKPVTVSFNDGESVFDVLKRVCTAQKIHMEYSFTPFYNSAYIEGIYNLYEMDAGPLSGWIYTVDGWNPNYGCSRYQLKDGQTVNWIYSLDSKDTADLQIE